MKSADNKSYIYEKNQLVEVICQLRFPTILAIEAKEPADFQDTVRASFPRYAMQVEKLPPQNGVEQTVKNYHFVSADGTYKLSLTKNFIALSTMKYTNWADFAGWLDEPLGHFISLYKPAFFERAGLRFVNGVQRSALGLEACRWSELFAPMYLNVLSDEDVDEKNVLKSAADIEMKLDEKCSLKLHAGPGFVKRNIKTGTAIQTVQEKESRFIFDMDIFSAGNISLPDSAKALDALHEHADRIFAEAITDKLHDAMEPTLE